MSTTKKPLRIANCSGFYGDRLSAAREMVEGGPIDVLTGDYLAELTMLLLWKSRNKDATKGYANTFLKQMEQTLGACLAKGIKVVANAGGLNPAGLAAELRALCDKLGLKANIAHLEGDDLLPKLSDLQAAGEPLKHLDTDRPLAELAAMPITANAYLGAWGIVEALQRGADVVICPRVTDASLVVGPAAWHFGWSRTDYDRIAGAIVAGHVVECGAQCTGGNYSFFQQVPGLDHIAFPIAEMYDNGDSVITKHDGTGGLVSVGTVTAQLLYEIDGPRYFNPDAVALFDTIQLAQEGENRVRVSGVRGLPGPSTIKVCINYLGGFRNQMTFVLTGLDIEAKARLCEETLRSAMAGKTYTSLDFELIRSDRADAPTNSEACAFLRATIKGPDPQALGRPFSGAVVEMALASYPGFYCTTPPSDATPYGVYWPTLVAAQAVEQSLVLADGSRTSIPHTKHSPAGEPPANVYSSHSPAPGGATKRVPLGTIIGARSGDKGGNANVGLWAQNDAGYAWLAEYLSVTRFKQLLPEAAPLDVRRFELPNLRALNFVVVGLLGEGVSSSIRPDPQAKSLGEYLRSRLVEIPLSLVADG